MVYGWATGVPAIYYPWHVLLILAWCGTLAGVLVAVPRGWRRWACPLAVSMAAYLVVVAWTVAAMSSRRWAVAIDRGVFLDLVTTAVRTAFREDFTVAWAIVAMAAVPLIPGHFLFGRLLRAKSPVKPVTRGAWAALFVGLAVCAQVLLVLDGRRPYWDRLVPLLLWRTDPLLSTWYSTGHSLFRPTLAREQSIERDRLATDVRLPTATPRRHIIVAVVDALRPDHLPFYGYSRSTAPFWSGLERQGYWTKVERAYSTGPESVGGISAIFQPRWPRNRTDRGSGLGRQLWRHGFRPHFFVSGNHNWFGLRSSYEVAEGTFSSGLERGRRGWLSADDDGVLADLETLPPASTQGKAFIFIHFMSPHEGGVAAARFSRWQPTRSLRQTFLSRPSSEEELLGLRNEYDNRILQADDQLRRAWDILRTKGYLEDAVVAVVADHGQALGEHGKWGHLRDVTEVLVRVPVTFWSDRPTRIPSDRLTSLIDVGPTLLAEAGVPLLSTWDGRPLQPESPIRHVVALEDIMFEPKWAGVILGFTGGTVQVHPTVARRRRPGGRTPVSAGRRPLGARRPTVSRLPRPAPIDTTNRRRLSRRLT